MEKKYILAVAKRDGRRIKGLLANDDGRTVYIISGGELFLCMRELYDFFEINKGGVLIDGSNCIITR